MLPDAATAIAGASRQILRACDLLTNLSEDAAAVAVAAGRCNCCYWRYRTPQLMLPDAATAAGAAREMLRTCDLVTNLSEDAADHVT